MHSGECCNRPGYIYGLLGENKEWNSSDSLKIFWKSWKFRAARLQPSRQIMKISLIFPNLNRYILACAVNNKSMILYLIIKIIAKNYSTYLPKCTFAQLEKIRILPAKFRSGDIWMKSG